MGISTQSYGWPQLFDKFPNSLRHCPNLLIGFHCIKVDHGGRLTAMGSLRATLIAPESHPTMLNCFSELNPCAGKCAKGPETRARAKFGTSIEPKEERSTGRSMG
jgi:hypothetical protein